MFYFILAATVISLLASCSTSRKTKSSVSKKSDSSNVSSTHKEGISKIDSLSVIKSESEYKSSIDILFEGDSTSIGIISTEDPEEKAIDLAGPKNRPVHKVNIGGKQIESTRPIKSISINTSGKVTNVDLNQVLKTDSGKVTTSDQVHVIKEEEKSDKNKERSGANVVVFLGSGLFILAFLFFGLKFGLFAFPKRRSNNNQS